MARNALLERVIPELQGWCDVYRAQRLAQYACSAGEQGAGVCVELGVFGGRATVAMAMGLRDAGKGRVYGIDPYDAGASLEGVNEHVPGYDKWWREVDYAAVERGARDAIDRLALRPWATILRLTSDEARPLFADGSVDLLYQDGNHSELVSVREVTFWTPKLRPGGIWVMDDVDWPATTKAQSMLPLAGFELVERPTKQWAIYRKWDR